jgi:hypothetical protein
MSNMSRNLSDEGGGDVDRIRSFDPKRRLFDPPKHPPLRDPQTNPRGVRHIDETAQDRMAVEDRPRYQAALRRRAAMIAAAKLRLRGLSGRRIAPPGGGPAEPKA